MTMKDLRNYLSAVLPLELNPQRHFRLLRTVFALVFVSTVVIHLLLQQDETLPGMLIHATIIGLIYTVAVGLATALLYALRNTAQQVQVWHLWAASLAGYVLGYYFLPLDAVLIWLLGVDTGNQLGTMGFLQLLPVWFLVTYLFVQPYLNEGLKLEIARLQEINALLERRDLNERRTGQQPIRFESGRTDFTLNADTIRNVVVQDHYCYVHYQHNGGYAKRDLAMPLRDVLALLPSEFVRVHRSHVVNLEHIASISRKNRSIRVLLDSDYEVPVSRHRLEEVLPLLRQRVAALGATGTQNLERGK
ncbi:MAG: LytR/AlgR family response regulator transcription factor [Pseudomonadales bacterium]